MAYSSDTDDEYSEVSESRSSRSSPVRERRNPIHRRRSYFSAPRRSDFSSMKSADDDVFLPPNVTVRRKSKAKSKSVRKSKNSRARRAKSQPPPFRREKYPLRSECKKKRSCDLGGKCGSEHGTRRSRRSKKSTRSYRKSPKNRSARPLREARSSNAPRRRSIPITLESGESRRSRRTTMDSEDSRRSMDLDLSQIPGSTDNDHSVNVPRVRSSTPKRASQKEDLYRRSIMNRVKNNAKDSGRSRSSSVKKERLSQSHARSQSEESERSIARQAEFPRSQSQSANRTPVFNSRGHLDRTDSLILAAQKSSEKYSQRHRDRPFPTRNPGPSDSSYASSGTLRDATYESSATSLRSATSSNTSLTSVGRTFVIDKEKTKEREKQIAQLLREGKPIPEYLYEPVRYEVPQQSTVNSRSMRKEKIPMFKEDTVVVSPKVQQIADNVLRLVVPLYIRSDQKVELHPWKQSLIVHTTVVFMSADLRSEQRAEEFDNLYRVDALVRNKKILEDGEKVNEETIQKVFVGKKMIVLERISEVQRYEEGKPLKSGDIRKYEKVCRAELKDPENPCKLGFLNIVAENGVDCHDGMYCVSEKILLNFDGKRNSNESIRSNITETSSLGYDRSLLHPHKLVTFDEKISADQNDIEIERKTVVDTRAQSRFDVWKDKKAMFAEEKRTYDYQKHHADGSMHFTPISVSANQYNTYKNNTKIGEMKAWREKRLPQLNFSTPRLQDSLSNIKSLRKAPPTPPRSIGAKASTSNTQLTPPARRELSYTQMEQNAIRSHKKNVSLASDISQQDAIRLDLDRSKLSRSSSRNERSSNKPAVKLSSVNVKIEKKNDTLDSESSKGVKASKQNPQTSVNTATQYAQQLNATIVGVVDAILEKLGGKNNASPAKPLVKTELGMSPEVKPEIKPESVKQNARRSQSVRSKRSETKLQKENKEAKKIASRTNQQFVQVQAAQQKKQNQQTQTPTLLASADSTKNSAASSAVSANTYFDSSPFSGNKTNKDSVYVLMPNEGSKGAMSPIDLAKMKTPPQTPPRRSNDSVYAMSYSAGKPTPSDKNKKYPMSLRETKRIRSRSVDVTAETAQQSAPLLAIKKSSSCILKPMPTTPEKSNKSSSSDGNRSLRALKPPLVPDRRLNKTAPSAYRCQEVSMDIVADATPAPSTTTSPTAPVTPQKRHIIVKTISLQCDIDGRPYKLMCNFKIQTKNPRLLFVPQLISIDNVPVWEATMDWAGTLRNEPSQVKTIAAVTSATSPVARNQK